MAELTCGQCMAWQRCWDDLPDDDRGMCTQPIPEVIEDDVTVGQMRCHRNRGANHCVCFEPKEAKHG